MALKQLWPTPQKATGCLRQGDHAPKPNLPSHPPTYYLPPSAVKLSLHKTARQTFCEVHAQIAFELRLSGKDRPLTTPYNPQGHSSLSVVVYGRMRNRQRRFSQSKIT